MINVKGSKTQAQDPDPAQRYVLKNVEKKSNTPFAFGVFLMGLAVYLKSIFPSKSEPIVPDELVKDDGKTVPGEQEMVRTLLPERLLMDDASSNPTAADASTGSGGTVVQTLPPVEFVRSNSPVVDFVRTNTPVIDFMELDVKPDWVGFNLRPLVGLAANDNSGLGEIPRPVTSAPDPVRPTPEPAETDNDRDPVDEEPTGNSDGGGPRGEDPVDEPCRPEGPCEEDDDPEPRNHAPRISGPVYLMDISGCAILTIALSDLLHNAVDPDGDMLVVKNLTVSSGTITPSGDTWVFQSGPQLEGPVIVTYQITDGEFTVEQTAHFSVVRSFVEGSGADDILLGTMCADDISGGDGSDNIDARAGMDVVNGGSGDDHIVAGDGDDTVFGGAGNDIVFGGTGKDHIAGGAGNDKLFGDEGDDSIFGDTGNDHLKGGDGADLVAGGEGDDIIDGDAGEDTLVGDQGADILSGGIGGDVIDGGSGNDTIYGGDGSDTIIGGTGVDTIRSGKGNDRVVATLGDGDDFADGGAGFDSLDYSRTTRGVTADLQASFAAGTETGTDVISRFEAVLGGSGDDALTGDGRNNVLYGNGGDDVVAGGGGNDLIEGNAGDDVLSDGNGEDVLDGGSGNDLVLAALDGDDDTYDGGECFDTLDYSLALESVRISFVDGTATGVEIGDDAISGFEAAVGGNGDDHFIVGTQRVILTGGEGSNIFEFTVAGYTPGASSTFHEILDFKVGDRIRMSKYDLFEEVLDELENRFEKIYGNEIDDDDVALRYRHDRLDEVDRTTIEADLNNDDIFETTISLKGHHLLVIVENT